MLLVILIHQLRETHYPISPPLVLSVPKFSESENWYRSENPMPQKFFGNMFTDVICGKNTFFTQIFF